MKLALFYNLNFTKVYINFRKVRYSMVELYVKSVHLKLSGWRGSEVQAIFGRAQAIKV
jgi:hypothetical protein